MNLVHECKDPLHLQIRNIFLEKINNQEWKPGDCLPSEREICERYNVSRITVRNSLAALARDGLIHKIQGKGTFVSSEKLIQPLQNLRSFSDDMKDRGLKPSSKILLFEVMPANAAIASKLKVQTGSDVIILRRLRLADNEPMAIETAYLRTPLFLPLLDKLSDNDSLYKLMNEVLGINLISAQQSIEAAHVNGWEASLLGVVDQALILFLERLSFKEGDIPVEYTTSKYRGDRYKFHINLQVM
ncbi:MAG: GntR family transcriptional regulator [Anaerolineaceae bacterium]|nr:GntR family transcriptional regulator [Anaerolineaceae bacterium]